MKPSGEPDRDAVPDPRAPALAHPHREVVGLGELGLGAEELDHLPLGLCAVAERDETRSRCRRAPTTGCSTTSRGASRRGGERAQRVLGAAQPPERDRGVIRQVLRERLERLGERVAQQQAAEPRAVDVEVGGERAASRVCTPAMPSGPRSTPTTWSTRWRRPRRAPAASAARRRARRPCGSRTARSGCRTRDRRAASARGTRPRGPRCRGRRTRRTGRRSARPRPAAWAAIHRSRNGRGT